MPRIVDEFMRTLELLEIDSQSKTRHYTFCLLTTGDSIGRTMERFVKLMIEVKSGAALDLNAVDVGDNARILCRIAKEWT